MAQKLLISLLLWPCLAFGQSVQIGGQVSVGGQTQISITSTPPFAITTQFFPTGSVGVLYTPSTVQTVNGIGTVTCQNLSAAGDLPTGLTFGSNCVLSGTPTQSGNFTFTIQATDSSSPTPQVTTGRITFAIGCPTLSLINPLTTLNCTQGISCGSYQYQTSGGVSPLSWTLQSGSLDGLTVNSSGLISGTPTAAGTFSPTIQVADSCPSAAQTQSNAFSLIVASGTGPLALSNTSPLPAQTAGSPVSISLGATGGTSPYTFTAPGGWLPSGLSVSGSTITGTTTAVGTFSGTLQVTDSLSATSTGASPYSLTINPVAAADNSYCAQVSGTTGNWTFAADGPVSTFTSACFFTPMSATPSPGATTVTTAANLQTAYAAAACGDKLVVTAGTSKTGPTTLTGKGCDDAHWITIEGSEVTDPHFPAEGTMATPLIAGVASLPNRPAFSGSATATTAPQLIASASNSALVLNGADHIRFIGLELTRITTPHTVIFSVLDLTSNTGTQTNHIIFDRDWVHGVNADGTFPQTSTTDTSTTRGLYLAQSNHIALIDSYCSDFYDNGATATNGNTDAQCIGGGVGGTQNSGWGVYKFVDNHMEGASETILLGGSGGPALSPAGCTFGVNCNDDVPTSIEVRRNELFKSMAWFGNGTATGFPNIKNGIEFKTGKDILFEGNISENGWYNSQPATYAWDIAPKNQSNGAGVPTCLSCLVKNVIVRGNYAYHYPYGPAIYSTADIGCGTCTTLGANMSVHDNVWGDNFFFNNVGSGGDNLEFLADAGPMTNISIRHNTGLAASRALMIFAATGIGKFDNITIQDNLFPFGNFGVQAASNSNAGCDNGGTGGPVYDSTNNFLGILNHCVNGTTNTWTADHNGVWGSLNLTNWPAGNTKVATIANVGFSTVPANNSLGYPDSGFNPSDWALSGTSIFHNAASDGKDVGADITYLQSKIAGVRK